MVTLLSDAGESELTEADARGDALWVRQEVLRAATGWELKPEGLCREEVCVPLPPGREDAFVQAGRVNLAALWDRLGKPVLHSEDGAGWVLGESAESRAAALHTLQAPAFTLPDLEGRPRSLDEFRGQKVLLVTWASW